MQHSTISKLARLSGWRQGLLLGIAMACSSTVFAEDLMQTMLRQYYPTYYAIKKCQGILADSGVYYDEDKTIKTGYCVQVDTQKVIDTPKGKRWYILTTGDVSFTEDGTASEGSHVDMGLVGMFVFKPSDNSGKNWQIESANPYMNAGSFGKGLKNWSLLQFSPTQWGFLNKHADSHYQISGADYVVLTPRGTDIQQNFIGATIKIYGDRACDKKYWAECTEMTTKINVDKSRQVNGFYPLKIVVNGHNGKTVYHNKPYRIVYRTNKGYVEPKNYPLKDYDF
jgi:hypothetical protein